MARKFKELQDKTPPEVLAESRARARKMIEGMVLDELPTARQMTQATLASALDVSQSDTSSRKSGRCRLGGPGTAQTGQHAVVFGQ